MLLPYSTKLLILWMMPLFWCQHWQQVDAFTVKRKHLAGIWKLKLNPAKSSSSSTAATAASSLTIKLQDDGSFRQFDDDAANDNISKRIEGCWDYDKDDNQLQLAIDPGHSSSLFLGGSSSDETESSPNNNFKGADTLLTGKISRQAAEGENSDDVAAGTTIAKGEISSSSGGKSTTNDDSKQPSALFFADINKNSNNNDDDENNNNNNNVVVGKFKLKQVMSFYNLMMLPPSSSPPKKKSSSSTVTSSEKKSASSSASSSSGMFKTSDFFGRRYVMKVVPDNNSKIVKPREMWDSKKGQFHNPLTDRALYFQTMEIQFFTNSTFVAIGINNKNKILRGKFQVTPEDKLWFSVDTSVVSSSSGGSTSTAPRNEEEEGTIFASSSSIDDDQRTYIGKITPVPGPSNKVSLRVQGKVSLGGGEPGELEAADLKPMGEFLLTEQMDTPPQPCVKEEQQIEKNKSADSTEDDDVFNSVFE